MSTRRSSRRQRQAAATRQDILSAARRLFADNGYVATSMAAIAREADTAVQTIYDSVGPKSAIILALLEATEEEAGVGPFRLQLAEAQDSHEMIRLYVALTRQFMERCGDVVTAMMSAAPTEPDVAAVWQVAKQNHLTGASFVSERLVRMHALRPDVASEEAATTLSVLTWSTTWRQLTEDHGLSFDDAEGWLNAVLERLLLREAT